MAGRDPGLACAFVVGANQRTSALALRDRLYVHEAARPAMLARLRAAGLVQALLLATCDRIEVHGIADDAEAAIRRTLALIAERGGVPSGGLAGQTYCLTGEDAVRHVFLVAASLDSTVIGEPHILGQIKSSLDASRAAGIIGADLEALVQSALAVGKRVRTETGIGQRPVSTAAAAVDLARGAHGDLAGCGALVLGAGEMGELIAEALRDAGLRRLVVVHPQIARSEAQARILNCHLAPFDDLARVLIEADIVIGSLGSRRHVVTADMVRSALRARRRRPMLMVDVAVPGDVEPAVDRLDDAFLYTFDDLERIAADGRQSREVEAGAARRLVDEAVDQFVRERAERAAVPLLMLLRQHFEATRQTALADAGEDADRATRLLVNRLLHGPTKALRSLAADPPGAPEPDASPQPAKVQELAMLLKRLFDVDDNGRNG